MLFEGEDFSVDIIDVDDLVEITKIYNSNKKFLTNHMNKKIITYDWLLEDMKEIKDAGFSSCKITDKNTGKIFGIIDFKISKETYLSLLMLHNDYVNNGLGGLVYKSFEEYIKTTQSSAIRIDIITSYNKNSINFWKRNGFTKLRDVNFNWTDNPLSATLMKKEL